MKTPNPAGAQINKRGRWYEYCRPYLEQLNPRDDLELQSYVEGMVARAKEFNADTLVMMADDGGYPLYPSKLAPINSHIHGEDLLGMIERECRANGLRFGLGFLGVHCNTYIASTRPEWAMRTKSGETIPFYEGHLICLNSGYGEYYVELIGEALARYAVDYLYVEGLYYYPVGPGGEGACYCEACKSGFEAQYGKPLAEGGEEERRRFYDDSITRFQASVKRVADRISPETAIVGTIYNDMFGIGDVESFAPHCDMIAKENMLFGACGSLSPHMTGLGILRLKGRAKKPTLGTWWPSFNVDMNFHQHSPAHSRLTFLQCLAYGGAVQPHVQTLFDFERFSMPILAELFSCVDRVRPYILDATLLPYIAVLDGPQSLGYCYAFIESHLPFDLITRDQLDRGVLANYRAVVVGDGAGLSASHITELVAYVNAGGGLLCSGEVSGGLDELAGVRIEGELTSGRKEHPLFYRFDAANDHWRRIAGRLLATFKPLCKVTLAPDCGVEAQIIGLDSSRMHTDHMGIKPYPADPIGPMLVTRRVGAGRVLYLAGDLASMAQPWQVSDADIMVVLAQAALWTAGGDPPISTNAPPSVELVTHVRPDRIVIFVMNESTNQTESQGIIRYVVPLSDIEVRLRTAAPVQKVTAVTGNPMNWNQEAGWLTVCLTTLAEYEILLIDQ